jgi:hypothetical protein
MYTGKTISLYLSPQTLITITITASNNVVCRSQWPRGLMRRSTAARLLRSLVRIPTGAWTFFFCVCVACCQVEVSATSWSLVQRSPTGCGASLCVIKKTTWMRRPQPRATGRRARKKRSLERLCYCADGCCFRIDSYNFLSPEITPNLKRS